MPFPARPFPSTGSYTIVLSPSASQALAPVPLTVRVQIRRILNEVALVADALASNAADKVQLALHFEIAGYAVNYAISDRHQTLTVLNVARGGPASPSSPRAPRPSRPTHQALPAHSGTASPHSAL